MFFFLTKKIVVCTIMKLFWSPKRTPAKWCTNTAVLHTLPALSLLWLLFSFPKALITHTWNGIFGKFWLWSPEYWALESGTLLREIWNPSKDWNPESKFPWQEVDPAPWNGESSIQDCLGFPYMGQPWIPRNNLFLFAALRFQGIPGNSIFQLPWNLTPLVPRNS